MKNKLITYYYIIITIMSFVCCHADESTQMVGSLYSTRDGVITATDIVIGKFTKVRAGGAASMLGVLYHGQITVLEALKGNASGSFEVGFSVQRPVNGTKEAEPNFNDTYIIIISSHGEIRKLLPATDDNISKVKALIAALPAPK